MQIGYDFTDFAQDRESLPRICGQDEQCQVRLNPARPIGGRIQRHDVPGRALQLLLEQDPADTLGDAVVFTGDQNSHRPLLDSPVIATSC
jgi:hypothetical protein